MGSRVERLLRSEAFDDVRDSSERDKSIVDEYPELMSSTDRM